MASEKPEAAPGSERLVFRFMKPGDEDRLQRMFQTCADYFQNVAGSGGPDAQAGAREIHAAGELKGRKVALITLREGGQPIGAAGWWAGNPKPDRALMGMLMIAPRYRKQGYGREAIAALEKYLAPEGIIAIRTAFQRSRTMVVPMVRALGFREMSVREHTELGAAGAGISLWEKKFGKEQAPPAAEGQAEAPADAPQEQPAAAQE
ncbi:MAG TPA: GNAT family N-acetyltransferase [Longimicrobium sp.]|nr:GNAT family N-acetyltransferase [Longimicrobium sp.]